MKENLIDKNLCHYITFIIRYFFFQALEKLQLDDNRITSIERRAFMNLDRLRYLTLRGNKIESILDEAFQVSDRI